VRCHWGIFAYHVHIKNGHDMTLKSKLGLLAAGTVIAVGTTYAAAQTRTSQTLVKPAVASPTSPQHKLSLDDQSLLLSLLNPEFSTAKNLPISRPPLRFSILFPIVKFAELCLSIFPNQPVKVSDAILMRGIAGCGMNRKSKWRAMIILRLNFTVL